MGAVDDDRPVEIMDEWDSETGAGRGTGVAAAHAVNLATRMMTGGPSGSRLEWHDGGRDLRLFDSAGRRVPWDPRAQPWHGEDGEQVWPRDDR